jgi:hypothetical protein
MIQAGGGFGGYHRRGSAWPRGGLFPLGGPEYVLPGERQAISADAQLHLANADVPPDFGVIVSLTAGMTWRF